jgi:NTE family protein
MNTIIKNLVFEGGGVKGIAFAGAIKALENNGLMTNVEKVAGTSAGAITATLVSIGCDADKIYQIISSTNFSSFEDGKNYLHLLTKYGLYNGDFFLNWIKGIFSDLNLSPTATFTDFKNAKMKDLHVFATDLSTKSIKEFSFQTTPSVVVAEAVRASMSIPFFFTAWKFPNNNPDNHIYVDGGVAYNYPITSFDIDGTANMQTLGLHLNDLNKKANVASLDYDDLRQYTINLFDILLNTEDLDDARNTISINRSIKIDDFGISATDFNITKDQQLQLYQSGLSATSSFIAKRISAVPKESVE